MTPGLQTLRRWLSLCVGPAAQKRKKRLRLLIELLEDRVVPSTATYTVTTNLDTTGGPQMSLRDAINSANADGKTSDIINFDATKLSGATIKLTSNTELLITKSVTIVGLGAGQLAIDGDAVGGNGGTRIFEIKSLGISPQVTISGLTLTHGHSAKGGAILNNSVSGLTLQNCALTHNNAVDGGAVDNEGIMAIQQSSISGNTATADGGGVFNHAGNLTVQSSSVSDNAAANGGGIYSAGTPAKFFGGTAVKGTLKVQNSTLSGNTVTGDGGAIDTPKYNTSTLQNATITGNSALGSGGGVYNGSKYTQTMQNCTIAYNKARSGGGIWNDVGTMNLQNTIVSDNNAGALLNDLYGSGGTIDAQYCLIETPPATGTLDANSSHNVIGSSANLGPLQYNGGAAGLLTLKPKQGSKSLGAGSITYVTPDMPTDERGLPRTFGKSVDIGAVEASIDYRRHW